MIRISEDQWRALAAACGPPVATIVLESLRENHADLIDGLDRVSLDDMIANALARAGRHRLSEIEDLVLFAELSFAIAPNFDEQPEIARLLRDHARRPGLVMGAVVDAASEAAWERAERDYDPRAWFSEEAGGGR
ncbi:hypothetical protein [Caulobacter endophyticus]|uniref:Uncharacterized protein n=1 Tax=Caulobacter endophyticus TaxID=2172652 RepID=A0A2T9JJD9_9CAUL|nr:hypothetical protein [Caulobacter endophyticus]PVM83802.1 hypothetical protein DDF67_20235 [Caulobacter endophyticus]